MDIIKAERVIRRLIPFNIKIGRFLGGFLLAFAIVFTVVLGIQVVESCVTGRIILADFLIIGGLSTLVGTINKYGG